MEWLIVAALAAAPATTAPVGPPLDASRVHWAFSPTEAQIAQAYPGLARQSGVGGRAQVICTVNSEHRLLPCVMVSEAPLGHAFGTAAANFSYIYRPDPSVPVGQQILFTYNFVAPTLKHPAASLPDRPVDAAQVTWERRPDADAGQFYPERAQRMEVQGSATVRCQVMDDLTLSNCKMVAEGPEGYGFGAATLAVSRFYKAARGTPIGEWVDIPTLWKLQNRKGL